jgi:hypothetical protein
VMTPFEFFGGLFPEISKVSPLKEMLDFE